MCVLTELHQMDSKIILNVVNCNWKQS